MQQEWHWSERFSPQPEIFAYANHVMQRFDLERDITFNTRVMKAAFIEATHRWQVTTDQGNTVRAQFVVMATGCLSSANLPVIKGIDTFQGARYHTGHWPHQPVDFTGQRVGIIGTGSSAVQSIPVIAKQARELHVFQRTAAYSVPAHNAPLDAQYETKIKADYAGFRARNLTMPAAFGSNHSLPQRRSPRRQMARRPAQLSGLKHQRFPQLLHHQRPRQPLSAHQHDRLDRTARALDRRLHRLALS